MKPVEELTTDELFTEMFHWEDNIVGGINARKLLVNKKIFARLDEVTQEIFRRSAILEEQRHRESPFSVTRPDYLRGLTPAVQSATIISGKERLVQL